MKTPDFANGYATANLSSRDLPFISRPEPSTKFVFPTVSFLIGEPGAQRMRSYLTIKPDMFFVISPAIEGLKNTCELHSLLIRLHK